MLIKTDIELIDVHMLFKKKQDSKTTWIDKFTFHFKNDGFNIFN